MKKEGGKRERKEGEGPEHESAHLLKADCPQARLPRGDSDITDQHSVGAEQGLTIISGRGQGHRARRQGLVNNGDSTCWPWGPRSRLVLGFWGLLDNSCPCGHR